VLRRGNVAFINRVTKTSIRTPQSAPVRGELVAKVREGLIGEGHAVEVEAAVVDQGEFQIQRMLRDTGAMSRHAESSARLAAELSELTRDHPNGDQLPVDLQAMLIRDVALRADPSVVGERSLLGHHPAMECAHALLETSSESAKTLGELLHQTQSAAERAVLERAIGWRRQLLRPSAVEAEQVDVGQLERSTESRAMGELIELADWIRGASSRDLAESTLLFLPEGPPKASSSQGPQPRAHMLFQYYQEVCLLANAQLVLSGDPHHSVLLRSEPMDESQLDGRVATEQREWFTAITKTAPRHGYGHRLWNWLEPLLAALPMGEAAAVRENLLKGVESAHASTGVEKLRERLEGRPSDEDLGLIHRYLAERPEKPLDGAGPADEVLRIVAKHTGHSYREVEIDKAGQGAALDALAPILEDQRCFSGVPVVISDDERFVHMVSFVDARDSSTGEREFLVFDTLTAGAVRSDGSISGIDWVPQSQILDGTFYRARRAFTDPPQDPTQCKRVRLLTAYPEESMPFTQ
jgi:hypothetical protein